MAVKRQRRSQDEQQIRARSKESDEAVAINENMYLSAQWFSKTAGHTKNRLARVYSGRCETKRADEVEHRVIASAEGVVSWHQTAAVNK